MRLPARRGPRRLGSAGVAILEILVAGVLASIVLGAALSLLRAHARLARELQATLAARSAADWALAVATRDIALAGADPAASGVVALRSAAADRVELGRDADGDGAVDASSAEVVALAHSGGAGGRLTRWVGRQPMGVASPLAEDGWRLRYFGADGLEVGAGGALDDAERARVCRVTLELAVRESAGAPAEVRLRSAAALRACFGDS